MKAIKVTQYRPETTATVIVDGQFGSTGKGLIAGYLAIRERPDTLMTAWSANAGHTYIDDNGRKFVHCMLANGIVADSVKRVLLGPGSQMNFDLFLQEVVDSSDLLQGVDILVHENAAIITREHVDEEAGPMTKIGSTKKGCGSAMIAKIRRNPDNMNTAGALRAELEDKIDAMNAVLFAGNDYNVSIRIVSHSEYMDAVYSAKHIQVEGAQGFSLGINSGFYPYVTSRECHPMQVCTDVSLPFQFVQDIVMTVRTLPIRVANRYNEAGEQVGYSGPCYPDQIELDWKTDLGMEAELTTVTKLPRRIFTFSSQQTLEALRMVRPTKVFINFANYVDTKEVYRIADQIDAHAKHLGLGTVVEYIGNGPADGDVLECTTDDIEEMLKTN